MIDSIRFDDGFGVSRCVDRNGPPADEGAPTSRITLINTDSIGLLEWT